MGSIAAVLEEARRPGTARNHGARRIWRFCYELLLARHRYGRAFSCCRRNRPFLRSSLEFVHQPDLQKWIRGTEEKVSPEGKSLNSVAFLLTHSSAYLWRSHWSTCHVGGLRRIRRCQHEAPRRKERRQVRVERNQILDHQRTGR